MRLVKDADAPFGMDWLSLNNLYWESFHFVLSGVWRGVSPIVAANSSIRACAGA